MKYYVMKNINSGGYLSRTLCRISKNGKFEIYDYSVGGSCSWRENDKYEKRFKEKDDNYEIYVPDKKEIDYIIFETDDAAYEDRHTHYTETVDEEGNIHTDYIYQDYRVQNVYKVVDGKMVLIEEKEF